MQDLLGPLPIPPHHPILLARFGLRALLPAKTLIDLAFHKKRARALFAGLAAHSIQPLERSPTASFGIMLGIFAHGTGWPVVRGGSQNLANALSGYLLSLGGEIITGWPVKTLGELPKARAYLFDVTPRQILSIAGDHLPSFYKWQLENFRYGPGVYKVDYALSSAIPWTAKECLQAATVHLGGTMEEIAASERSIWEGKAPERPFVLLAQQTLFDTSRAPEGKQTVWAYCHVPNGSSFDMVDRIESQVERFAPGFRDCILARNVITPSGIEQYDANYIGGDINGGVEDLRQLFTRPAIRLNPYTTPNHSIFICSSSTPPGGGVHGMCGFHAAKTVIREL